MLVVVVVAVAVAAADVVVVNIFTLGFQVGRGCGGVVARDDVDGGCCSVRVETQVGVRTIAGRMVEAIGGVEWVRVEGIRVKRVGVKRVVGAVVAVGGCNEAASVVTATPRLVQLWVVLSHARLEGERGEAFGVGVGEGG